MRFAAHLTLLFLAVLSGGCNAVSQATAERSNEENSMPRKVTPFLMFTGQAEEAMNFYVSLFDDAEIVSIERHGPGGPGEEGTIMQAVFRIGDRDFMFFDSPPVHAFTFTPSMSLFVTCADEAEIDRLFAALSEGGEVMMPLGEYPFAKKYAWLSDRFGVSWQLTLPAN